MERLKGNNHLGWVSEMLGLGNSNPQSASSGALNLSMSGAPQNNMWGMQSRGIAPSMAQQNNGFMGGMMGGTGANPAYMQQPMAPPSEMEIQLALLRSLAPIDRFIASPQMGNFIMLLNSLISYSVIEIFRNAKFTINDEDNIMELDMTSLPTELQTISSENVTSLFTTLQATAQNNINEAEMTQQQYLALAQQSMMGGALSAAMADPGLMNRMGSGIGSVARGLIGGR